MAILVELFSADAARLNGNDQGQRLTVRVLLKRNLLLHPIVGEREIVGGKGEHKRSRLGSYHGWNKH